MVRTKVGALYTGVTTDVARRFREHAAGKSRGARYLRGHKPAAIVFQQRIGSRSLAAKVEHQVKRLDRARKEAIVAAGRIAFGRVSGKIRPAGKRVNSGSHAKTQRREGILGAPGGLARRIPLCAR